MTEVQSAAVHIRALVRAEGFLPGISSYHQLLVISLASVPGGQLVNPQLHKASNVVGHATKTSYTSIE
ncbi:MAG: hypothetical protein WKG06_44335 [Segetibacter sp.]